MDNSETASAEHWVRNQVARKLAMVSEEGVL